VSLKKTNLLREEDPYKERVGLIYARVSSSKQKNEGDGLNSQETRCREELERKRTVHQKSFFDDYTGGGDFMKRPAMRKLLEYIDKNPHKKFIVIFDDLKRFARDTIFHLKLRKEFEARDTTLLCLNHAFDNTPEGEFLETVLAAQNELDRKQNQRQVVQKQRARLTQGYNPFHAPIGYKKVEDILHKNIDKPTKKAKYIKEALEGFANYKFLHKVEAVRYLQTTGVISPKQSPEQGIKTFDRMLKNPFYAGYVEYLPWEVKMKEGQHKPIIDLPTYEKNQKRLKKEKNNYARQNVREDFKLRGFINCSKCGKQLTGAPSRSKTGKLHNYYKCASKGCLQYGKSIRAEDIHSNFEEILKGITASEDLINLSLAIFEDVWREELGNKEKIAKSSQKEKDTLEEEVEKTTKLIIKTENETVIKQYEKQIEKLCLKIEEIETENQTEYDYSIPYRTSSQEVLQVFKNPYSVWENYDIYQKQKFFSFIFEDNLVYDKFEGYRTPEYSLPLKVFEAIEKKDYHLVETAGIEPTSRRQEQISYYKLE
jgi:site-specific DNA recombinase